MGQNLEITLSFKPLMEGIGRFVSSTRNALQSVSASVSRFDADWRSALRQNNERMQAFNQQISSGDMAVRRWASGLAAFASLGALRKFSQEALEADRAQQQLTATLTRFGQHDAAKAFIAESDALEEVTLHSAEAIQATQRLLVSYGVAPAKVKALTRSILDLSAATGQPAQATAMQVGRFLSGDASELSRYGIKIEDTKDKIGSLIDAIDRRYAGEARAAVTNEALHGSQVRMSRATEDLGRAVNNLTGSFLTGLVPVVQSVSSLMGGLMNLFQPFAQGIGSIAGIALGFAGISLGISKIKDAADIALNPVRSLIILLTGHSFSEINGMFRGTLGTFGKLNGALTLIKGNLSSIRGLALLSTVALAGVGAAVGGFLIGKSIAEYVNEAQRKRVAAAHAEIEAENKKLNLIVEQNNSIRDQVEARKRIEATTKAIAEAEAKLAKLEESKKATQLAAAAATKQIAFDSAGSSVGALHLPNATEFQEQLWKPEDQAVLDNASQHLFSLRLELKNLNDENLRLRIIQENKAKEIAVIEQKRIDELVKRLPELKALREAQAFAMMSPAEQTAELQRKRAELEKKLSSIPAAPLDDAKAQERAKAQRLDLENQIAAVDQQLLESGEKFASDMLAQSKAAISQERAILDDGYEQKKIDLEAYLTARTALLERQLGDEAMLSKRGDQATTAASVALARKQEEIEQQKIRREAVADARTKARAAAETKLQDELFQIDQDIARVEADKFTTEIEKNKIVVDLLERKNAAIRNYKALLQGDIDSGKLDPNATIETRNKIGGLNQDIARNEGEARDRRSPDPDDLGQQLAASAVEAENALGTAAQRAAQAWASTADSIRTSLGDAFTDMLWQGESLKNAMASFATSIAQSFIGNLAQMAADWIYQHTIMAAWKAITETKMTATAAAGAATRTGIVVGEETAATGAKAAGTAARTGFSLMEAGKSIVAAAAGAMSAVASIPWVGPILAVAAVASILALGAKVMGAFASGGLVRGPGTGTSDDIIARLSDGEYVMPAATVDRYGVGTMDAIRSGALDLSAGVESIPSPLIRSAGGSQTSGSAFASSPQEPRELALTVIVLGANQDPHEAMRDAEGTVIILDAVKNNKARVGISS